MLRQLIHELIVINGGVVGLYICPEHIVMLTKGTLYAPESSLQPAVATQVGAGRRAGQTMCKTGGKGFKDSPIFGAALRMLLDAP